MTDPELIAALTTQQKVALTMYGEARGEPIDGIRGIASVIMNRANAKGLSPAAIVLAKGQFSCWSPIQGGYNYETLLDVARNVLRGVSSDHLKMMMILAEAVIDKTLHDNVKKATHYYSPDAMIPKGRVPPWAIGLEPVIVIGHHRFFAGVKW